jgi:hypothetical protein
MKKVWKLTAGSLAIVIFFAAMTNISSCTKDSITIEHDTTTTVITIHDTVPVSSQMSLLTGKMWIFDSIYSGYTMPGTGSLIYTLGDNNPTYSNAAFCYFTNGTEADFNVTGLGTFTILDWSFINADSTEIYYPISGTLTIPTYQRILQISPSRMVVYDSTDSDLDIVIQQP